MKYAVLALALLLARVSPGQEERRVYKDVPKQPHAVVGVDEDEPEPADFKDVPIGYFGPADPKHPVGGMFWMGASLGVEEANREGYKGRPFRLVPVWAPDPWKGGVSQVARLAYGDDKIWALIGGIDSDSTHLAEQVAAKALFPIVDPASTDLTVNFANVPWIFSLLPGDAAMAETLTPEIAKAGRIAVITATNHDARTMWAEFRKAFSRAQITPVRVLEYGRVVPGVPEEAESILVLAGGAETAAAAKAIRAQRPRVTIFAGPAAATRAFRAACDATCAGVRYPVPAEPERRWAERFRRKYGEDPDYAAAAGFDAVQLVAEAVRTAGLNRARIRNVLQKMRPSPGAGGPIEWNVFGRNTRRVKIATFSAPKPLP